jgi:hypothetical protein
MVEIHFLLMTFHTHGLYDMLYLVHIGMVNSNNGPTCSSKRGGEKRKYSRKGNRAIHQYILTRDTFSSR